MTTEKKKSNYLKETGITEASSFSERNVAIADPGNNIIKGQYTRNVPFQDILRFAI